MRLNARAAKRLLVSVCLGVAGACSGAGASGDSAERPTSPAAPAVKPAIVLSVDSLAADFVAGAPGLARTVEISAGSTAAVSGLAVSDSGGTVGSANPWITESLSASTAPATLAITISPSSLTAGQYTAIVRVAAANADIKTLRVTLVVRPRPRLVLDKAVVSFSGDLGAAIAQQTIGVTSVDGLVDSLAVGAPDCGVSGRVWLAATVDAAKTPTTLRLSVLPAGVAPGTYTCSVVVSTPQALVDGTPQAVRATFVVHARPQIVLSTESIYMSAARTGDSGPYRVSITNGGTGALTGVSVGTIAYGSGGSGWLTVQLDSANAPTTITLAASARSLSPGVYVATVPIQSDVPDVVNSPHRLTVTFTVTLLSSNMVATPSQINLTMHRTASALITATLSHTGDFSIPDIGVVSSSPAIIWLGFQYGCTGPAFGTPCNVIFTPNPGQVPGLALGTYVTTMTFKPFPFTAGGPSASITVSITIVP